MREREHREAGRSKQDLSHPRGHGHAPGDGGEEIGDLQMMIRAGGNLAMVQLRGDTSADPATVHSAAARGIQGSGGLLPHYDAIQRSFGDHDVSGIRAHVGGAAREATASIGAEAYATGDHVAFKGAPDVHTAAHEAAHVVQQRAGVQLYGGVGRPGDAYERHADEVADRVVAGRPAQDLLDRMAGGGGAQPGAVQRRAVQCDGQVTALAEEDVSEREGHADGAEHVEGPGSAEGRRPTAASPTPSEAAVASRGARRGPAPRRQADNLPSDQRVAILRRHERQLQQLEGWLSIGVFDWFVTGGDARAAVQMLSRMPPTDRIVLIQDLNRRDTAWLNRLVENLEESDRNQSPATYLALLVVREDRPRLTELLRAAPGDYGVGPSQGPALEFAVRRTPNEVFTGLAREGDAVTTHVESWLGMTPPPSGPQKLRVFEVARQEARGVERAREERDAEHDGRRQAGAARLEQDAEFQARFQSLQDLLSTDFFDWFVTDGDAREVLMIFARMPATDLQQAVVLLDDRGLIERFINELPEADRTGSRRTTFLAVLEARHPDRNAAFVRNLLSTGFLNSVSATEARTAFRIVQRLPRDVQDEIRAMEGGAMWQRMEESLDQSDTNARDANVYGDQDERAQMRADYAEGCGAWDAARLRMRTEMLLRVDEAAFVERALGEAGVRASGDHAFLRLEFGLAMGGEPRLTEVYEAWRANRVVETDEASTSDTFGAVFAGAEVIGAGILAELGVDVSVDTEIDLQAVFELAGNQIGGVALAGREEDSAANRLGLQFDSARGLLVADIAQLNLQGYTALSDGVQLQVGATQVSGLRVEMKWPTEADPSSRFQLDIARADVREIWQTGQDGIRTVGHLALDGFALRGESATAGRPSTALEGVPLLLEQVTDTFRQLMTAVDLQETNPDAIASSTATSLMGALNMNVRLGSLTLENLGASDGTYAGEVTVGEVQIDTSRRRRSEQTLAQLAELRDVEAAAGQLDEAQVARRAELQAELAQWRAREARLDELLVRQRDPAVTLAAWEREELRLLQDEVTVAQTDVSVGSIAVTDLETQRHRVGEVTVTDVSASSTGQRTGEGGGGAREASATFSVGQVAMAGIEDRGDNRLERYEARVAELRERVDAGLASDREVEQHGRLTEELTRARRMVRTANEIRVIPPERRRPGATERLEGLEQRLAYWLDRSGGMEIDRLEVTGEDGAPAISGEVDTHGQMSAQVGRARAEGVRRDGQTIGSVEARGVALGAQTDTGSDPDQPLMARLASAELSAEQLEVRELVMQGRLSVTLERELETLREQEHLAPASLTTAQRERLAELPERLEQARTGERRIEELRGRTAAGETLTPEEGAELEALSRLLDERFTRVESATARGMRAGLDPASQRVTFGVAGDEEEAGLEVTGYEQGRRVDGEEQVDRRVDRVAVRSVEGEVTTEGGDVEDVLGMQQGTSAYGATLRARGVEVEGYEAGREGEAGHQRVDRASVEELDVDYQSGATGADGEAVDGRLDVRMEGAEVAGLALQGASRVGALHEELGRLRARQATGADLDERAQRRLGQLEEQLAEYEALRSQVESGRTRGERARARRRLRSWEATSRTTVDRVSAEDLTARVDGIGNVMDEDWSPTAGPLAVDLRSEGEIAVEGVTSESNDGQRTSRTTIDRAAVRGTRISGTDVLDEERRRVSVEADEVDVARFRSGGTAAGRVRGRGIRAGLAGDDATFEADRLGIGGGRSGGSSAGHIGLGGVRGSVTGMGTSRQRASGSAQSIALAEGRSRSATMDARVRRLRGRRASFSMAAGRVQANVASFAGDGVDVTLRGTDAAHQQSSPDATTHYGVDEFSGEGASFAQAGGRTTAGVRHLEARGIEGHGAGLAGGEMSVREVIIDGARAEVDGDGNFEVGVEALAVREAGVVDADGGLASVGEVNASGIHLAGNASTGRIEEGAVGELEVRDVVVDRDDMSARVELVSLQGGRVRGVDMGAGTAEHAALDAATIRGATTRMVDRETGAVTEADAAELSVRGAAGSLGADGVIRGSVEHARGRGIRYEADRVVGSGPGMIDGRRQAELASFDVEGVRGAADLGRGRVAGAWDRAEADGARYDEVDGQGRAIHRAEADGVSTGRGSVVIADVNDPLAAGSRAAIDDVRVASGEYQGDNTTGHVRDLSAGRVYGATTADGLVGGVEDLNAGELSFHHDGGPDGHRIHVSGTDLANVSGRGGVSRDGTRVYGELDEAYLGQFEGSYQGPPRSREGAVTQNTPLETQLGGALDNADGQIRVRHGQLGVTIPIEDGVVAGREMRAALRALGLSPDGAIPEQMTAAWAAEYLTELATGGESNPAEDGALAGTVGDLHVETELRDLGGGEVTIGDDASFEMERGGQLRTSGQLGRDFQVEGDQLGARNVRLGGDMPVEIDRAGAEHLRARVIDGGSRRPEYQVAGEAVDVRGARVGGAATELERAAHDRMRGGDAHADKELDRVPTAAAADPAPQVRQPAPAPRSSGRAERAERERRRRRRREAALAS